VSSSSPVHITTATSRTQLKAATCDIATVLHDVT